MLKRWTSRLIVFFISAAVIGSLRSSVSQNTQPHNATQTAGAYEPKIIVSDHEKIIVEFELPPLDIRDGNIRGVRGQLINLVGYSQSAEPGKPQVPLRGFSLGIPENARPTLQIVQQETGTRQIPDIPPAPRVRYKRNEQPEKWGSGDIETEFVYERDETVYARNEFFPKQVAKLGKEGIMRGQRIMTFQVFPVQFNPVSRQIKFYKKLRIAIYYNANGLQKSNATENTPEAFENIFKSTLLNYDIAKDWRIGRQGLAKVGADDYFLNQGSEWCKLYLDTPGIYIVEKSDLDAVGFDLGGANVNNLKMFNKGVEIAIRVDDGNSNGIFDESDYIEFYGTAFKNYYTTTNVYWLTVGTTAGKRMVVKNGAPAAGIQAVTFGKFKYHKEKDIGRRADYPGHTDNERFFMEPLYAPSTKTHYVNMANLATEAMGNRSFWLKTLGVAEKTNINPDHHIQVEINNNLVLNEYWDGRAFLSKKVNFDKNFLIEGENIIEIIGPGDTGSDVDWVYNDFIEIEYWRYNTAVNDSVFFTAFGSGANRLFLSGFSLDEIFAYDVSDSNNVARFSNLYRNADSIKFQDNISNTATYYALSQSRKRKPASIIKDTSAGLRASLSIDYVILSYPDFMNESQLVGDYHENNGLSTKVIDIQDIYDEFNYGFYEDKAIRKFFEYTYSSWSRMPTYGLLVGDASFNPRTLNPNSYGSEKSDYVPTRLFEANEDNFEAGSDNYFGCVQGDDILPEILIGRFPARNAKQVEVMAQKTINYATDFQAGDWNNTATFVADNGEGGVMAFEDSSDAFLEDLIPKSFIKKRIYLRDLGTSATKSAIKNAFDDGTLIMNYLGHGSRSRWAAEAIFTTDDVPDLRNDNDAPYVLTLSCINGYFLEPQDQFHSLAEALLRERQRGAVTVFSGSGEAYPSPVLAMGRKIYGALFQEHNTTVGSFSTAGLIEMYARYPDLGDHVMFYILFGDPATRLHYQPPINYASAGFEGTLSLNGAPAALGTEILAAINKQNVGKTTISQPDGHFEPFYIAADNPVTSQKEGGAPGDTVSFSAVLANRDSLQLYPPVLWKGGQVQKITLSDVATSIADDLAFEFYVDGKKVGETFFEGDPVPKDAVFRATITSSGQLTPNMFQLQLNDELVEPEQYTIQSEKNDPLGTLHLVFQPRSLADGFYELTIKTSAPTGLAAAAEESVAFQVQSALRLDSVVNFPNPMRENSKFTFILQNDKSATVQIKIYTVAGRLIRVMDAGYAGVGYHETDVWDGTDEYGDKLANGTYFYKIVANDGEEQVEVIEKLVVMR